MNIYLDCCLYSLDSVNIFRKYLKCIDQLFNNTSDLKCTISTTEQLSVSVNNLFSFCVYFLFLR